MGLIPVAVLVSGNGSNLQALIDSEARGENPDGRLSLVIASKPGVYALERAAQAHIPSLVLDKSALAAPAFEARLLAALAEAKIGLVVLAGFLHILSADFIRQVNAPIINIHPALLPAFGGQGYYGLKVHEAVLAAGVAVTGATVHVVNEIPDGGRILRQKEVPVLSGDTPESLQQRVMAEGEWLILPAAVAELCRTLRQQTEALNHALS